MNNERQRMQPFAKEAEREKGERYIMDTDKQLFVHNASAVTPKKLAMPVAFLWKEKLGS